MILYNKTCVVITKKVIIELRENVIDANKKPAFSESMGIGCKNLLKEALLLSS